MIIRTMGPSVNVQRAGAADSFAAVVVEGYGTTALAALIDSHRVGTFPNQLLVEDVQHFEEGCILFYAFDFIGFEMSLCLGVFLTPYLEFEIHTP